MQVSLVMQKADGTRRDFTIQKERVIIGRTSHCDLRIPLSSVSRRHCELRVEGDEVVVRDLGSSNGTFHNGTRVQEATLQAGDEITIGPVAFMVVVDGKPEGAAPVKTMVGDVSEGIPPEPMAGATSIEKPYIDAELAPDKPEALEVSGDDLPLSVEADTHTPTVDLDDPIAALEAMARSEAEESGELPLLAEDDEEEQEQGAA